MYSFHTFKKWIVLEIFKFPKVHGNIRDFENFQILKKYMVSEILETFGNRFDEKTKWKWKKIDFQILFPIEILNTIFYVYRLY